LKRRQDEGSIGIRGKVDGSAWGCLTKIFVLGYADLIHLPIPNEDKRKFVSENLKKFFMI